MKIYKISAVTLIIENMKRSCRFYSQIPGFKLVYGGSSDDNFTTFEIEEEHISKMCLNLELSITNNNNSHHHQRKKRKNFGRIIFYTEDVDRLYSYFRSNKNISNLISFENEPTNAAWGERYFHIREPDGYQLSFAKPIANNKGVLRY
jgi:catechol 2,3-dioxygenase-like lactoylglutathione lyase family enzyme